MLPCTLLKIVTLKHLLKASADSSFSVFKLTWPPSGQTQPSHPFSSLYSMWLDGHV